MSEETELVSAALEACGLALQVRDSSGGALFGNPLAAALFKNDQTDAPDREERGMDGRALWVERRRFDWRGRPYLACAAIDVDAQRKLQDELYQRAYFDTLTGLPNRELCDTAVSDLVATLPRDQAFALALIEIEKFGQINAVHGSATGDALLQRIAERIGRDLGEGEWLGRSSGDEFCLIMPRGASDDENRDRLGRLIGRLAEPFFIDGIEIFASAKSGVSVWPRDDIEPEKLWRKARTALAEAKRAVGARVRVYDPELERAEIERAKLEMSLRAAIRDRRIGCAFQPKVDFRTGVIDSLEVLMRWRDEDGAWNSPGDFLDVAHRIGLTNDITRQVFEQTLESLDVISETFRPGLHIGFNISARQAGDARFMRRFAEDLAASGHADRFVLELTEEAFLPATQFQSRVLPMLREIGAKISIDDFGAGFSSLATLADITADEVKVDRSLIIDIDRKPRNQTLLRAIESIGSALGMEVMVEGVETEAELGYIRDHTQIRVAQGYLLGRPILLDVPARPHGDANARFGGPARERATAHARVIERRQT